MSQIPITQDYAQAVGTWCEKVENRSLLLDKFALPKNWGAAITENSASSWSLMRVSANGVMLLSQIAQKLENPGRNVYEDRARDMRFSARAVRAMTHTNVGGLDELREKHTTSFLNLLKKAYPEDKLVIVNAKLEGRLAINLAEGVIQNAGISLDRIFGLPVIPGSAVKGVARHAAWEEEQAATSPEEKERLKTLRIRVFGNENSAKNDANLKQGAVSFLQATPTNLAKIVVDITNVHYPDYYNMHEDVAKTEKPNPNPFPAVERGAEFAFPIVLNGLDPDPEVLKAAKRWLERALTENGLGAKTAAGYGWFSLLEGANHEGGQMPATQEVAVDPAILENLKTLCKDVGKFNQMVRLVVRNSKVSEPKFMPELDSPAKRRAFLELLKKMPERSGNAAKAYDYLCHLFGEP